MTTSWATIQEARQPWNIGKPLTRTVKVPSGYTREQAERWLQEKLLMKSGEFIVSYMPDRQDPWRRPRQI